MPSRRSGPEHVLGNLANYAHRIAISNRRILSFNGGTVTFSGATMPMTMRKKTMELDAVCLTIRAAHTLPKRPGASFN